ncbi:aldehyde dehydrogenase domain-containing protein [Limtongia smithiae]|uniref:aldehyde dehydrogenase domain-containing protein n=1 Tax=Limtongia smithiae TaxID=1125753 RepID=UPI0034CDEB9E
MPITEIKRAGLAAAVKVARQRSTAGRFSQRNMATAVDVTAKLTDKSLFKQTALVGAQQVTSSKVFEVTDPATQAVIGTVPDLDVAAVDAAIDTAHDAFVSFRGTSPFERARVLQRWNALMLENIDDLATILTYENGKPLAEAKGEIRYSASFLEWFAGEAPRAYGDVLNTSVSGHRALTIKQPVGVVSVLTPWNFPAAMITRKVSAAVAAGCTVVIKPDAETPYSALALAELARRAGVPDGVLNVVTTKTALAEVGQLMCADERVKKLSFTGSTAVGKLLMAQSSASLKKLSFELGGNAPFIVFDDVDVDEAVAALVACKFRGSGQTCVCANRVLVHTRVYDEFVEKLVRAVSGFTVGNGFADGVTHGPLIHARALDKVTHHVADAVAHGGEIRIGGSKLPGVGKLFFAPTVVANATPAMAVAHEETFGPLAAVFRFETENEALALANDADVGLASYVITNDVRRALRVAESLQFGMVGVNTGIISDCATPFGGVKFSGFGREGSKYGMEEYMVVKTVTLGGMPPYAS